MRYFYCLIVLSSLISTSFCEGKHVITQDPTIKDEITEFNNSEVADSFKFIDVFRNDTNILSSVFSAKGVSHKLT